ncbi:phosphoribosyltransferase family protein [Chryseobacterium sp. P1-3]|uniref:phosphoribosyltransferase family protein n=1 Tax=Chryseobacterium sp. (strain P1-3) TaxID=1517683 RepID=UPI002934C5D5|nr:phosphoribosyltransferase family protein [Chryseobacterium sp. P1-3]
MLLFLKSILDFYLFQKGRKSSIISKINRNHTYITDYGNLSFEDRKNLIANDTYYIDKDFFKRKNFVFFIDDIKNYRKS